MGRRLFILLFTALLIPLSPAPAGAVDRSLPGTAWGDGEVMVDSTVSIATQNALGRSGFRVIRLPGELRVLIAGGQGIYGGTTRCSLGANVRRSGIAFFITAGHCTAVASTWYANASHTTVLGARAGSSFPGNDYGIVRYTNTGISHPSAVFTHPGLLTINGAGNAFVGLAVCRSGSTTGVRCGAITGLNQTVNFPDGTVTGLIRTNICAEPGDSGGPLYNPATGQIIGILSGGSGNCTTGGITFYQPIGEILAAYGVTIP
ncbi:MAG TPA: S1 family peptidase [Candidatus Limnocylindrales bacterium]|nr:S1 family peptidase [Candidatus Limnocylindrales bacterium]